MLIKCNRCGKTFQSRTIKKYCTECSKELNRISKNKYWNKNNKKYNDKYNDKYNANEDYRLNKINKQKEKFNFDNYYGLVLGTTNFGSKRKYNFKDEQKLVRKQKNIVLSGKTYTNPKYVDLFDDTKTKSKSKTGVKKRIFKSCELPKNINNTIDNKYYIEKIIKDLNINLEENEIIGVYKVSLNLFNKYILFTKYKGRVIENIIQIPKRYDLDDESID